MAARFGACACRSGPRRGIVFAALVGQTGPWRLSPARLPRASLRTRYGAAVPAWKVARLRERSARRRVWVPGAHTDTSGINPSPTQGPISRAKGSHHRSGQYSKLRPIPEAQASIRSKHCSLNGCSAVAHSLVRVGSSDNAEADRNGTFVACCSVVPASNSHPPPGGSLSHSGHLPRWPGRVVSRPEGRAREARRREVPRPG